MAESHTSALLCSILEELAAMEHERWAHWQSYVHSKGERRPDGALIIPGDLVRRWESQISRSYVELTEAEKESDREQVRRYLPQLAKLIGENG